MNTNESGNLSSIYVPLRLVYGLVPLVAGLDKFLNLLTDWDKYLPTAVVGLLPISAHQLMLVVGAIEILAGLAVLTSLTRLGSYVVMVWLVLIALNLIAAGYYDIAVRDLAMSVGAYTLGRVAAIRNERWIPFTSQPKVA